MARTIRIGQLAAELNVSAKAILDKLTAEGLNDQAPNSETAISLGLAETIREWFEHGHGAASGITAIEIENFKAFGDRQRIELRPITLLFGPNSGGKSSVLHAIHYAREILLKRNIDVFRCESGGNALDLGGFGSVTHRPTSDGGETAIQFELDLEHTPLPSYNPLKSHYYEGAFDEAEEIAANVRQASVRLVIGWHRLQPALRRYEIGINGEPLAAITLSGGPHLLCSDINWEHPLFDLEDAESVEVREERRRLLKEIKVLERAAQSAGKEDIAERLAKLRAQTMASGRLANMYEAAGGTAADGEPLFLAGQGAASSMALPVWGEPLPIVLSAESAKEAVGVEMDAFRELLSQLIVGPGELLARELEQFRYLGPLRTIPPRHLDRTDRPATSQWACGLGAWDKLLAPENWNMLQRVSDWLWQERRLNTGYRLIQANYREITDALAQRMLRTDEATTDEENWSHGLRELMTEYRRLDLQPRVLLEDVEGGTQLQPLEVGVGISQVVPVIVAAMTGDAPLVAIEQPELHLHPRQQTALGDLFIHSIWEHAHSVIVETHSEHLLLRLLKRIRQKAEGTLPDDAKGLEISDIAVIYIKPGDRGSVAKELRIDEQGEFLDDWPDGFFDERGKELFE